MAASAPGAAAAAATVAAAVASSSGDSSQQLSFSCTSQRSLPGFLGSSFNRALPIRPVQGHQASRNASWIAPVNEVVVDGSSNAVAPTAARLDVKSDEDTPEEPPAKAKEATISALMADVSNLVKLVDSRDIVELELKHLDYELVIRKKEALLPPPAPPSFPAPQIVTQTPYPYAPPPPPSVAPPTPASTPAPPQPAPSVPSVPSTSDLPRILSPMAGTFYRNPAPGEPPFVKVGDKVQKGQVICIVEAMKLMNEIEADQTGTVVEIIAEDGKPVAVDTPLFAIKP